MDNHWYQPKIQFTFRTSKVQILQSETLEINKMGPKLETNKTNIRNRRKFLTRASSERKFTQWNDPIRI